MGVFEGFAERMGVFTDIEDIVGVEVMEFMEFEGVLIRLGVFKGLAKRTGVLKGIGECALEAAEGKVVGVEFIDEEVLGVEEITLLSVSATGATAVELAATVGTVVLRTVVLDPRSTNGCPLIEYFASKYSTKSTNHPPEREGSWNFIESGSKLES